MKNQDFNSFNDESDDIDLGKFFRLLLMQSKLIFAITAFGFAISLLSNILSTKQYSVKSLLQYESVNQNIFDPSVAIQSSFGSPRIDISNLIALYKSRTNIIKLIKDLKLNIDIKGLSDNESIDISIKSNSENEFLMHNLIFSFSNNGYSLLNSDLKELASSDYGEYIYFNGLEISIYSANIPKDKIVKVDYSYPESLFNYYSNKFFLSSSLQRNSFIRDEGLITVSYVSHDRDLGKRIVNYANEIFLNQRILDETEKSRKALDFINTNLKSLSDSFESKKIKLNQFREKNQSIDVRLEIEGIVNKIAVLDESLGAVELAIAKAKEIYTENNTVFLNLLNEKKIIEKQKKDVMSLVELMPKEQQEYIDLYNDMEVSQALYKELETRRFGLSILEASTIGDIRIVDDAYYVEQVSPKFIFVIALTFLSMLIGSIVAIIRGLYFMPISNPAELSDNNINLPIIGVVPDIDIIDDKEMRLNQSIESLIVSIDSMNESQTKNNMIAITSPSPGNGKSFIALNLAKGYANLGKKVLLIDGDHKRGRLGKVFHKDSIDKEVFFSIDTNNIENFVVKENFYLIPRLKNLYNSFEFLYNNKYQQKIDFFKDYFDYIMVDTAPILSVTDTSILVEKSDFNILIAKHAINRINQIKQSVVHFEQIGKNIDGIIYNGYKKPHSYYGYYGLYGNYAYQYYAEKYLDEVYDYKK